MRKLSTKKKTKFLDLFSDAQSKSDLVATFLAVLELAKTKKISIDGSIDNPDVKLLEEVNGVEE